MNDAQKFFFLRLFFSDYIYFSLFGLWVIAILLIIYSRTKNPFSNFSLLKLLTRFKARYLIELFFILLPSLSRTFYILFTNLVFSARYHGDEVISAYYSAQYSILKNNFFAPVPINKSDWVCQFPSLYFFLQKIFFLFFGENIISARFSVLPYVFLISIFLFLLCQYLYNKKIARLSLILYAFFAPALYFETRSFHFVSSTAIFLINFYLLIIYPKSTNKSTIATLIGWSLAFSYLFYTSSYLALPITIFFYLTLIIQILLKKQQNLSKFRQITQDFILSILIAGLILLPFFTQMVLDKNFYLLERTKQVDLLSGTWSPHPKTLSQHPQISTVINIISQNLLVSLKSIYQDNTQGDNGFWFNHLPFFDQFTLLLFILGCLACLFLIFKKKHCQSLILINLLTIVIAAFILGIVLTIPPPAFHRFTLAYPFLIIIIMAIFYLFDLFIIHLQNHHRWQHQPWQKIFHLSQSGILFLIIVIYIFFNINHFLTAICLEDTPKEIPLVNSINQNYQNKKIYLAAFPNFHLYKVIYFFGQGNVKKMTPQQVDYHQKLLNNFNPNENYLYILLYPKEFKQLFIEKDSSGQFLPYSEDYGLFVKNSGPEGS